MTDESEQKWKAIMADYQLSIKTYSTLGALHTLAQHWVENEIIIERAANEEADKNGPKWTPDYEDQDSMGEYFAERDLARDSHDKTMLHDAPLFLHCDAFYYRRKGTNPAG